MGKRRIPLKSDTEPTDSILAKPVEAETDLHGLDARGAEAAWRRRSLARYVQRYTLEPGGGAYLVELHRSTGVPPSLGGRGTGG